ncbi:MAG: hypothetical protein IT441_07810 [Phycisphaeraceae bacterium]|nr:hypothetical protein [Phycisphaeraceae bacterium]
MDRKADRSKGFAAWKVAGLLTLTAGLGWLAARGVVAARSWDAGAVSAVDAAVCVAWLGAMLGLAPVMIVTGRTSPRAGDATVMLTAALLGMGLRLLASAAAVVLLYRLAGLPARGMLLGLGLTYLPLLVVEVGLISRYGWRLETEHEHGARPEQGPAAEVAVR